MVPSVPTAYTVVASLPQTPINVFSVLLACATQAGGGPPSVAAAGVATTVVHRASSDARPPRRASRHRFAGAILPSNMTPTASRQAPASG